MTERYDLEQMLREIEEDEKMELERLKGRVSQDDIRKMLAAKREDAGDKP
ncbi:MAG: hypothetical protein KKB20_24560 [Proteobacteria bacterium]|nr:hypothetical protein [Pseudomonadota bacterium]